MRFMILVKASADSEAGVMPSEELLTAMGNFNEALAQAGVLVSADGLHPSDAGYALWHHELSVQSGLAGALR